MSSGGESPRLAVVSREKLSPADRQRLADLLVRTGISWRLVAPSQAEVHLHYGEAPEDAERPALALSRHSLPHWRSHWHSLTEAALTEWKAQRQIDPSWDLPKIHHSLLRGWEEEEGNADPHGRFAPESSLLLEQGALDSPVVDQIARKLGEHLFHLARPNEAAPSPRWFFCATLDIDSDGMFYGRQGARNLLNLQRTNPAQLPRALWTIARTRLHILKDPHLRLRELAEMLEGLDVPASIFVQTHRRHRLDNYYLGRRRELLKQLRAIAANRYHEIGLHSSYATRDEGEPFFRDQWNRLAKYLPSGSLSPVHRAHYLRTVAGMNYAAPAGASSLIDSSLGFGSREGFRRGTAYPFRAAKQVLELCPAVMDTTLRFHRGLDPGAAFDRSIELFQATQPTGGAFVLIWHPNNMDDFFWPKWKETFIDLLTEAKRRGAVPQTLARAARFLYRERERLLNELTQTCHD